MTPVTLRPVLKTDLPTLFEHHIDRDANVMAAFTVEDPHDRREFERHWGRLLRDDAIVKRAIVVERKVVGNIIHFTQFGNPAVGYWIAKEHWGKGIASAALKQFLPLIETRPLYARAAKDNLRSLRVLEKCGFRRCGEEMAYSTARGEEIAEVLLMLAR